MTKEIISIPSNRKLPLSPAIRAGDFIFVSGQPGYRADGSLGQDIQEQTKLSMESIKRILEVAGSSLADVVKVNIFLKKAEDWSSMNEIYLRYFQESLPTRATIVTGLVSPAMLVEIECIAYHPSQQR